LPPRSAQAAAAGGRRWAELTRQTYGLEVLACPRCGGRLRLVALVDERPVVERILRHLGLPADLPVMGPGRPPSLFDEGVASWARGPTQAGEARPLASPVRGTGAPGAV